MKCDRYDKCTKTDCGMCDEITQNDTDIHKPNCVTCDHFGKCEGCEKREEE